MALETNLHFLSREMIDYFKITMIFMHVHLIIQVLEIFSLSLLEISWPRRLVATSTVV